jgi:hypothetical protein
VRSEPNPTSSMYGISALAVATTASRPGNQGDQSNWNEAN